MSHRLKQASLVDRIKEYISAVKAFNHASHKKNPSSCHHSQDNCSYVNANQNKTTITPLEIL